MKTLQSIIDANEGAQTQGQGILALNSNCKPGETVTIGDRTFELVKDPADVGDGNVPVDISGILSADTPADSTLTATNQPNAGGTVTVGDQVYTFVDEEPGAGDVEIGANFEATLANLAAAINGDDNNAANESVTATSTSTTVVVTAIPPGSSGNGIPTTSDADNLNWAVGVTSRGKNGTATGSDTRPLLVAAINTAPFWAEESSTSIVVRSELIKYCDAATSETFGSGGNTWKESRLIGGSRNRTVTQMVGRTLTSAEIALGAITLVFQAEVLDCLIQARTSGGTLKTPTGAVTLDGKTITIVVDGGSALAAGDRLVVVVRLAG